MGADVKPRVLLPDNPALGAVCSVYGQKSDFTGLESRAIYATIN